MRHLLIDVLFWIGAGCCLVAQVAIVRSTMRPHEQTAADHPNIPRPHAAVEIAWLLLPAVVLIGVFALTWQAMHQPAAPSHVEMSATPPVRTLPARTPTP